jgi:hypothetical protein
MQHGAQATLDSIGDAVMGTDLDGRVTWCRTRLFQPTDGCREDHSIVGRWSGGNCPP